jgi:putative radical SAM enzyme (TIGR03279 family)
MQAIINQVPEGSFAEEIGLKKGDIILSMNGHPVHDIIDYMYYSRDDVINLKIRRGTRPRTFNVRKKDGDPFGFELKPFRTKTCRNKCVFCFVDQLPKGMRKTLYLKDDDFRMSFLFGNYITLSNLNSKEKKRILEQKLSPLYVSIHSTNNGIRRKMIGNPKAPDILKELLDFTSQKIRIHGQIVVCPGLNDGDELANTIKDLQKFYPYVASIAVVPVGVTKYNKSTVKPVTKDDALKVIDIVKSFRRRLKRRHGDPLVYLADEFYLKAGLTLPPLKEYGDLPQLENGVGPIPLFLQEAKRVKMPKKVNPKTVALFTGASFMPFLQDFAKKLKSIEGLTLDLFKVENTFFGPGVTVSGLLTGKDIVKTILGKTKAECLLVPSVALRNGSDIFLDNVTLKDMTESLGIEVKVIDPTPEGLIRGITDGCQRKD